MLTKTPTQPRLTQTISSSSNTPSLLPFAYIGGSIVELEKATLNIASAPVLYGLSVYSVFNVSVDKQGIRRAFRLSDHYRRLTDSCRIMSFELPEGLKNFETFASSIERLVNANAPSSDILIRAMVYIDALNSGTRMNNLPTQICAYAYPAKAILPAGGCHLAVSSWQRTSDTMIPARAKVNGSYVNASLAKNEALSAGFDDCVMLDQSGHVAESSVSNIFIFRHNKLLTPSVSGDILEGITRDTVLTLADELGVAHEQRAIDRTEL